jgi:hypothetical protein
MKSLKVLILIVSFLYPACSKIQGAELLKRTVGDSIRNVDIELNGSTTVVFKQAGDIFEVLDYKYSGIENDPLSIMVSSDTIKLKLRQKWSERHEHFRASLVLSIPKGKALDISCGNCKLSGTLEAESLDISAGNLDADLTLSVKDSADISSGHADLKLDFDKCKTLDISSGYASGDVSVPYNTDINVTPFWNRVRIARK